MLTPEAQSMFQTHIALTAETGQRNALRAYSLLMQTKEAARLQGKTEIVAECEQRIDILRRYAQSDALYVDPPIAFS